MVIIFSFSERFNFITYMSMCTYMHMSFGAHGVQKRSLDPLALGLQVVLNSLLWGFSVGAVHILNG